MVADCRRRIESKESVGFHNKLDVANSSTVPTAGSLFGVVACLSLAVY